MQYFWAFVVGGLICVVGQLLTGGLTAAADGITTSLVCGVVCSWVGKSHDQN